jgi:hypothetical protein
MKAQDYPIAHFDFLLRLSSAFEEMPAQLLEHYYSYESFGSWSFEVKYSGNRIKVEYDGKESHLSARYAADRKPPYGFGPWVEIPVPNEERFLSDSTVEAICEHIRLPKEDWPATRAN